MKILDDEERNEHWNTVLVEGIKGCVVGAGCAALFVGAVKRRYPTHYLKFNLSIKAAMWAMPTIGMGAFFADDGSWKFDEKMYRSDYLQELEKQKLERWEKLSTSDKAFTLVNDNKYKIIISAWAASLYGSWYFVNKDKYMTVAQKAVQARVYAQAITVVLLLSTLLLSMHERELAAKEPAPVPEWKRYLAEQEAAKKNA
ncbi:CIC11C00000004540 [Sungouiella intermedia]|uniref:CIC11C00000000540 n=1 Tax=Sungouiella intermedia TaxID=45354 RepID=A0A1L0C471_9ASCO|nr:CIC11C00000004540 [[Candida] intermedia]SGZ57586.1 CIC11C00000000540 [[Candida] intermedia]